MSLQINTPKQIHRVIRLKKNYYSYKKLLESKNIIIESKFNKQKSNESLNNFNYKTINLEKRRKKELLNIINFDEIISIYGQIFILIQDFIQKNKENNSLIFLALYKIYSNINSIFSSLTQNELNYNEKTNENINAKSSDNLKNNNFLDNNSKLLYELKIEELNKKIKKLNQDSKITNFYEVDKANSKLSKKDGINNYLKKKILELEDKLKINEYNYLLYIQELQNKLSYLENDLRMKEILKEYNESKNIRCFPNLTQFNLEENINPKSIPLTKSILKDINSSKKKNNLSKLKELFGDSLVLTNSRTRNTQNIKNSKQNHFKTADDDNNISKKVNIKNNENENGNEFKNIPKILDYDITRFKSYDFLKQKNINDEDEEIDNNFPISSRLKKISEKPIDEYNEDKNLKILKNFNIKNIINKEKKYFISHPNLTIAGINKKNKYNKGLPNKLFSFKFSKNFEKDAFFIFPSIFSETIINLKK